MIKQSSYNVITGKNQLSLLDKISTLRKSVWPDCIRLPDDIIFKLYELYPDFQISLLDENTDELIGLANTIPLDWRQPFSKLSDEGLSWVLDKGITEQFDMASANILCAISITVSPNHRNKGISKILLKSLKQIALNKQLTHLIVPVRPSLKSVYPLIPINEYLKWKNKDDLPFDPWLRTHVTLGAKIIKVCNQSARITASIEQWEHWTGMRFPSDGAYVIKDALSPVEIEYKNNMGTYIEPNVWVEYALTD